MHNIGVQLQPVRLETDSNIFGERLGQSVLPSEVVEALFVTTTTDGTPGWILVSKSLTDPDDDIHEDFPPRGKKFVLSVSLELLTKS